MQNGIAHGGLPEPEESALLIDVSRHLGAFLERLFETDSTPVRLRTQRDGQVARFKKEFVTKRVAKAPTSEGAARFTHAVQALVGALASAQDRERDLEHALAVAANRLIELERDYPRGAKSWSPSM